MKKILPLVSLVFSVFLANAQNGLECVVVERYYVSNANDTAANPDGGVLPVGSVTYRVYADMLPGYKFQAAYGNASHELRIETSTLFFNNEDRGATAPTYSKVQASHNTVMLDSWLSVGAACTGQYGILKSLDDGVANVVNTYVPQVLQNNDPLAGIPLTVQDGLIAGTPEPVTAVGITAEIEVFNNQNDGTNGPVFSTFNGAWSSLNGSFGPDTIDNKVLIAQITTDGNFSFQLNIQIGTPLGGVENYVALNPSGAEIQLPCLSYPQPNILPVVDITSPPNGSIYGTGTLIPITATASDSDGIVTNVDFFVNGTLVGSDATAPYSFNWTSSTGQALLTAVATDNNGGQTTSAVDTIDIITQIREFASASSVNLFPNPAQEQLTIVIKSSLPKTSGVYTIYDNKGSVVLQKNIGNIVGEYTENLDVTGFSAGLYLLHVMLNGDVTTSQFVIK